MKGWERHRKQSRLPSCRDLNKLQSTFPQMVKGHGTSLGNIFGTHPSIHPEWPLGKPTVDSISHGGHYRNVWAEGFASQGDWIGSFGRLAVQPDQSQRHHDGHGAFHGFGCDTWNCMGTFTSCKPIKKS